MNVNQILYHKNLLKSKTFSVTLRLSSTKHLDYERSRTYTSKS